MEDLDGWYYVVKLAGTPDFGPYAPVELSCAFDVEPEPITAREVMPINSGVASDPDATRTDGKSPPDPV